MYAGPVQELIDELGRLPGIGPKSAQRIAFHLLKVPPEDAIRLSRAIADAKAKVVFCRRCFNVAEGQAGEAECGICTDPRRDSTVVCVVEVILCTNPNIEGEATAMYLARLLRPLEVRVTRIASGLPVGGDLEYADELTLGRALEGRRELDG